MIIGDGSVGKTCILTRFCENKYDEAYIPTIFENYNKEYTVDGKTKILRWGFDFWLWHSWLKPDNISRISDTAGQEDYANVRLLAYPGTDVVIMAFNIMSRPSFENITETWNKEKVQHMKKAKVGKHMSIWLLTENPVMEKIV